jgi:hypothetical protein
VGSACWPWLAALVVALPVAAEGGSASRLPLAGCEAAHGADGRWVYTCEELLARLEDAGGKDLTHRRALVEEMVAREIDDGLERWAEHRTLGGQLVQVRRFHSTRTGWTTWFGALALPEGTRIVGCTAFVPGARCAEVLELLAEAPWGTGALPGTVPVPEQPLRLGGLVVPVPEGCTGEVWPRGRGEISCARPYHAHWEQLEDEAAGARTLAEHEGMMERLYALTGVAFDEEVPCRLAGVRTTCHRWIGRREGRWDVVLAAVVPLGGRALFAVCLAPAEADGPGVPCRQVFEVRRRRSGP